MSVVKIAEDKYQNKLQFTHIDVTSAKNLAAASTTVWDATSTRHVVITPTGTDAYVSVTPNGTTTVPNGTSTGYSLGKFIPFGGSYTTIIRAGERIATSAIINVVSLGEV